MLSVFIFDVESTTRRAHHHRHVKLWFAFSFYLWCRINNLAVASQQSSAGCDLLSVFIFDVESTTTGARKHPSTRLWFAFSFYLWCRINNHVRYSCTASMRCDLLSVFIFDVESTTCPYSGRVQAPLWFAFSFYLWCRINNRWIITLTIACVVICFQFLSLM